MKLVLVNNTMASLLNQRLRIQKSYSAANSLMMQLNIPQGHQLLYVLGYPNASDNKGAICQWIMDRDSSVVISNESYSNLKRKLRCVLIDLEQGELS